MIGRNLTVAKACKRSTILTPCCPGAGGQPWHGGGQPSREGEKVRAMADLHS